MVASQPNNPAASTAGGSSETESLKILLPYQTYDQVCYVTWSGTALWTIELCAVFQFALDLSAVGLSDWLPLQPVCGRWDYHQQVP